MDSKDKEKLLLLLKRSAITSAIWGVVFGVFLVFARPLGEKIGSKFMATLMVILIFIFVKRIGNILMKEIVLWLPYMLFALLSVIIFLVITSLCFFVVAAVTDIHYPLDINFLYFMFFISMIFFLLYFKNKTD